ncbi:MAG: DMT family transporter [Rhodobacteraceae bacterium]|nr:DMT family transporter [Paracoccaceae bacterium]
MSAANNVSGIFLVILAMASFTLEDMFIKRLSLDLPTGQILLILGTGSALVFALLARAKGQSLFQRAAWRPLPVLRAASEAVAAMSFASALALVDISTVAAVFQTMPLAVTLGAALFLGEQVGWRRWSAIGLGFAGVLLIIRPGLEGFDPNTLLVLIAVAAVAFRDLATRRIDASISSFVVSFQGFASLLIAGPVMLAFTPGGLAPMAPTHTAQIAGAVLFGVIGYWGIVTAMRVGEASVIAPYRYTRLLFSIIVGVLVFGDRPDLPTLLGATLIIGTGLYTFLRERALARPAPALSPDFPQD